MNRYEPAESFILRHCEGIFEHLNARRRRRVFIVNGDHVETPWHFREAAKVSARHSCQLAPLFMIDGSLGGLHIVGSPGFHLNKTKNIAVPADEIDLPAPARRTVIAGNHHIAQLSEIEVGILFALTADLLMRRQLLPGSRLRAETIENAKSSLREWGEDIQNAR